MNHSVELLRAILFHLERSQRAYLRYRPNPVYLHACNIYKGNEEVVRLITTGAGTLTSPVREKLLDLLEHLDVWMEQFRHLERELKPDAETKFVFERFPETPGFPGEVPKFIQELLKKDAS